VAYATEEICKLIRRSRKQMGMIQRGLELSSGFGLRFNIELEEGKESWQLSKAADCPVCAGTQPGAGASGGQCPV
jgi:hypothetical protein